MLTVEGLFSLMSAQKQWGVEPKGYTLILTHKKRFWKLNKLAVGKISMLFSDIQGKYTEYII